MYEKFINSKLLLKIAEEKHYDSVYSLLQDYGMITSVRPHKHNKTEFYCLIGKYMLSRIVQNDSKKNT